MNETTCCICDDPFLPGELVVESSAEPYNLRPSGLAHEECAHDAMIEAIAGLEAANDAYLNR